MTFRRKKEKRRGRIRSFFFSKETTDHIREFGFDRRSIYQLVHPSIFAVLNLSKENRLFRRGNKNLNEPIDRWKISSFHRSQLRLCEEDGVKLKNYLTNAQSCKRIASKQDVTGRKRKNIILNGIKLANQGPRSIFPK